MTDTTSNTPAPAAPATSGQPEPTYSYLLRDIDPILWRAVRGRAAAEGQNMRALFLSWLRMYQGGRL